MLQVLSNPKADATQILKALKHYIKTEKKDELHVMNHFKHVHDTDPQREGPQREQAIAHLVSMGYLYHLPVLLTLHAVLLPT